MAFVRVVSRRLRLMIVAALLICVSASGRGIAATESLAVVSSCASSLAHSQPDSAAGARTGSLPWVQATPASAGLLRQLFYCTLPLPRWLMAAEARTLDRGFGGARPIHTWYTPYPHKIAVTFVFNRVVVCGACSAPSNASLPRGRVIRVSYDRQTHRQGNAIRFCESRGSLPPLSQCLRH